jgi:hypothetical protein
LSSGASARGVRKEDDVLGERGERARWARGSAQHRSLGDVDANIS